MEVNGYYPNILVEHKALLPLGVNVTKLFGWNTDFSPKLRNWKKIVLKHEPSQNVQKYTHKLFIDFRIAYFCCFSLDFLDLQFK